MRLILRLSLLLGVIAGRLPAADSTAPRIDFETYNPKSTLVVPEQPLTRAKFPFIDVHNHQRDFRSQDLPALLRQMDELNLTTMVNLSGGSGTFLSAAAARIKTAAPSRLLVFANVTFGGFGREGWTEKAVAALTADHAAGASGLKLFKNFGMSTRDQNGQRIPIDDPRMDPIWARCGELKIPVLIHTGEPRSFWDPMDENNERWLELITHPGRRQSGSGPGFEQLIHEQHAVFKRHPKTTFIAAHFDWHANDLTKLGAFLDEMPNVNVETGAIIAELGRQPRAARAFFERYQDRILVGKDSWVTSEYATYFRVFETEDEYFPYHKKYHAFWPMYGMGLPDAVLKKIYYKNALRIIPGIDRSLFPE